MSVRKPIRLCWPASRLLSLPGVAFTLLALGACATTSEEETYTPASFAQKQAQCADAGDGREAWAAPAPPVHIYGNTYDVGTCGIIAVLVTSPEGHVLLDTGVPEAADLIVANLEALGVDPKDVRWMLSSHEHYDHIGATAEIKRRTGARAAALARAQRQLETGLPLPEDPQNSIIPPFEGFTIDRVMRDGEVLQFGGTDFTIHSTPVHTPGSSSWTWQSCRGEVCRTIAYADSISTPAADDYRFSDHPDYVASLRPGFSTVAALPCDILLTPHPSASGMDERLANGDPYDPDACKNYAAAGLANFEERLAMEAPQ